MLVFGGKGNGAVLVQEMEKAESSIEILAYLFLAPRTELKNGLSTELVKTISKKTRRRILASRYTPQRLPSRK